MADPGGPNRPRPPPPFPTDFFFFAFHTGGRSGREKNVSESTPLSDFFRPGAASRHLDSRPSIFTNPGSASGNGHTSRIICSRGYYYKCRYLLQLVCSDGQ